ncbi:MAG TPA: FAD/NAD(P)-binding protein [Acidimicrobiales bacterium]|nr:FAD/NAD(P)-binding protein [Acidimicrobiales bacterium]
MAAPDVAPSGEPMMPVAHRVVERIDESPDTVTLVLAPVDSNADEHLPAPGQFNMLWSFAVGEVPISVSGIAADHRVAHTIRSVGPVTGALTRSEPGDVIGVRGPFGTGWDIGAGMGRDLLIVGGGIGLAPLRPVLHSVLAARGDFGRVAVLVGARSPDALLFTSELEAARSHDIQVEVVVDQAPRGWTGDVGLVTALIPRARVDPETTAVMVCGPEVMMRRISVELLDRCFDADRLTVSVERNMQCAVGTCGHCQLGPLFVCRDGPVVPWPRVSSLLEVRER